jgi:hypothetical protein
VADARSSSRNSGRQTLFGAANPAMGDPRLLDRARVWCNRASSWNNQPRQELALNLT